MLCSCIHTNGTGANASLHSNRSMSSAVIPVFSKAYAVAGIGRPQRFFDFLRSFGLTVQVKSFPDHYVFSLKDFPADPDVVILMTEKDAVKCRSFSDKRFWYVRVKARVTDRSFQQIQQVLRKHA